MDGALIQGLVLKEFSDHLVVSLEEFLIGDRLVHCLCVSCSCNNSEFLLCSNLAGMVTEQV